MIDSAQSQISGNASNELDDQLQILFANRRIDQGYAKNEELDFLGVRGQNSLLNSHAHYNYLSSIINSVNKDENWSEASRKSGRLGKSNSDTIYPDLPYTQKKTASHILTPLSRPDQFSQPPKPSRNNIRSSYSGVYKGNESYGENVELVVGQVVDKIRPSINELIESTLIRSNGDVQSYRSLLKSILADTEPLALNFTIEALKDQQWYPAIKHDSDNQVLSELRPLLTEAIRNGIEQKNLEFTENDIVKIVSDKMKNNLHRIIKRMVSSAKVAEEPKEKEKLVLSTLNKLRLIVNHAVQKTIKTIDVRGLNSTILTNRIIEEISPSAKIDIAQEINAHNLNENSHHTTIVGSVIQSLWADVIHFVQEGVREYKREPNNANSLIDLVLSKLRPVILRSVKENLELPEYKNLDSKTITTQVTKEIRKLLQVGDLKENEVFKTKPKSFLADDILVQDMKI